MKLRKSHSVRVSLRLSRRRLRTPPQNNAKNKSPQKTQLQLPKLKTPRPKQEKTQKSTSLLINYGEKVEQSETCFKVLRSRNLNVTTVNFGQNLPGRSKNRSQIKAKCLNAQGSEVISLKKSLGRSSSISSKCTQEGIVIKRSLRVASRQKRLLQNIYESTCSFSSIVEEKVEENVREVEKITDDKINGALALASNSIQISTPSPSIIKTDDSFNSPSILSSKKEPEKEENSPQIQSYTNSIALNSQIEPLEPLLTNSVQSPVENETSFNQSALEPLSNFSQSGAAIESHSSLNLNQLASEPQSSFNQSEAAVEAHSDFNQSAPELLSNFNQSETPLSNFNQSDVSLSNFNQSGELLSHFNESELSSGSLPSQSEPSSQLLIDEGISPHFESSPFEIGSYIGTRVSVREIVREIEKELPSSEYGNCYGESGSLDLSAYEEFDFLDEESSCSSSGYLENNFYRSSTNTSGISTYYSVSSSESNSSSSPGLRYFQSVGDENDKNNGGGENGLSYMESEMVPSSTSYFISSHNSINSVNSSVSNHQSNTASFITQVEESYGSNGGEIVTQNYYANDLKGYYMKRGAYIPIVIKFLIAVRYYATGSFQLLLGDTYIIAQSTVSKIVSKVSMYIAKHRSSYVKYPTFDEAQLTRSKFFKISEFPGVVGAIDCTHVQIESPGGSDPELFRNRKGVFSINVQAICDADLVFRNIVSRWYGSCHDSRIFENSFIKDQLESKEVPWLLVGDAGYGLRPFLMTPFDNPDTIAKKRYNKAQIKARNPVERAFGVLKRRFPCIKFCRLKLKNVQAVIVTVFLLHNIARMRNDIYENDDYEILEDEENENYESPNQTLLGQAVRMNLVSNHFENR